MMDEMDDYGYFSRRRPWPVFSRYCGGACRCGKTYTATEISRRFMDGVWRLRNESRINWTRHWEEPMKVLLFDRMKFKKGLNFTVRLGDTWLNIVKPGDFVQINSPQARDHGVSADTIGKIEMQLYCSFLDIPDFVLKYEHDPKCRDIQGLGHELFRHYGDDFNENTLVTCLGFRVLKEI